MITGTDTFSRLRSWAFQLEDERARKHRRSHLYGRRFNLCVFDDILPTSALTITLRPRIANVSADTITFIEGPRS